MKDVVKEFKLTGELEIIVPLVVEQWNENCYISQWGDEYTLCEQDLKSENFTKTCLKVRISITQSEELIEKLNLTNTRSTVFTSGSTWK
jgi:hypothetical protein